MKESNNSNDIIDVFDGEIIIHSKAYIELFYKYSKLKHYFVIVVSSEQKIQEYHELFTKIGCKDYFIVQKNIGQLPLLFRFLIHFRRSHCPSEEKSLLAFLYKNRKKKILFHGNVITPLMIYMFVFYSFSSLNWVCWGAILGKKETFIRSLFIRRLYHKFKRVICLMSEDAIEIKNEFNCKNTFVCPYPSQRPIVDKKYISSSNNKTYTKVLVGNSGHSLDSYIELCKRLTRNYEKIHFTFMRVYGSVDRIDFEKKILQYIDKKNFDVWDELLTLDQYYDKLNEYDIYVCPHINQTGLGAIYSMIKLEKTLYLSGYNYNWINSIGIKANSLDNFIENISMNHELKLPLEILAQNKNVYTDVFSNKRRFKNWDALLSENLIKLKHTDIFSFV